MRCSLGSIAPGGRAVITIVVRPTEPGALINTATVVGAEPEANTANNRASTPTLVKGPFRPPVATCPALTVQPRSLSVGPARPRQGARDRQGSGRPRRADSDQRPGPVEGCDDRRARPRRDLGAAASRGYRRDPDDESAQSVLNEENRCRRRLPAAVRHGLASSPASRSRFSAWTGEARAEAAHANVPAAGHISWAQVAVRATPSRGAPRTTVLTQFRADFTPRVVLALGVRRDARGRPAWYRISLPAGPTGGRVGFPPPAWS